MNIQAGIDYAGLWVTLFLALALAIAYLVYFFRNKSDGFSKIQMWVLACLRFLSVFLIAFFLISPLIENIKKRKEKPTLIIGVDISSSMLETSDKNEILNKIINPITEAASSAYDINLIGFGSEVRNIDTSFVLDDKISNYSNFFDDISDRYFNLNVGSMVIVGDGIFNEGKNPQNMGGIVNFPIFAVGLGDTTSFSDQAIISALYNPNVFLGNNFSLELALNFSDYPDTTANLKISNSKGIVFNENIKIPQKNYYLRKQISLKAENPGLQSYEIRLQPFSNERNTQNNYSRFSIEVHQNKQQILVLSQGPHPDNGAIVEALRKQANFEVSTVAFPNFDGNTNNFDLIVLNQLPSNQNQQNPFFKELSESKKPILAIVGPNTSIAAFNNMKLGLNIKANDLLEEIKPIFNSSFSRFGFPAMLEETSAIYPPLLSYLSEIEIDESADILATQRINEIPMKTPLIVTTQNNNHKIGIILGEGIWRWRLKEYQDYGHQNTFDQFVINFVTYLCQNKEREQFRIQYDRIHLETAPLHIKAQLFNDVYEPVLGNEIRLTLTDSANVQFDYLFDAIGESYFLNLGLLKPGNYKFEAQTTLGGKDFTKNGAFTIQEVLLEQQNKQANFDILSRLAQSSGGKFFTETQIDDLIKELNNKENQEIKIHREKKTSELIDWKWIFCIIVLFLSLEWFLRKFWDNY